jgi:hypothetical protein
MKMDEETILLDEMLVVSIAGFIPAMSERFRYG